MTVQRHGTRHMIVSVLFPHAAAERDPDSLGRLQRLVPHLLRAAQLERQFAGIETRGLAAEAALDRLGMAMLIVDRDARLAYRNAAAEAILAAGDGLLAIGNRLAAIDPAESRALRQLAAGAVRAASGAAAEPGGVIRIRRRAERPGYEVLVAPLAETLFAAGFGEPMAAVFIRDPDAREAAPAEWLQRLHGLTRAEARVMRALVAGDTPATMVERFRVGAETLRTQLKAVYRKTDTANQAQLVRLALRGLAAFHR